LQVQETVGAGGDESGQHRCRGDRHDATDDGGVDQNPTRRTQRPAQQHVTERGTGHEAEAVGRTEISGDQLGVVGEAGSE